MKISRKIRKLFIVIKHRCQVNEKHSPAVTMTALFKFFRIQRTGIQPVLQIDALMHFAAVLFCTERLKIGPKCIHYRHWPIAVVVSADLQ